MAITSIQPGDAPANPKRAAFESLAKHRDYRGFSPFAMINSHNAEDRANSYISGASCILSFMSAAFTDSGALVRKSMDSEVDARTGEIIAGALEGVATLIDMAGYLLSEKGE